MRAVPVLAALALAALAVAALAPLAGAHGTFEANELEVHVLSDEGSDAIESYGGYDIQDLFVGFAHDPGFAPDPRGDGFYLRAELYGLPENAPPAPGQAWIVTFTIGTPAGSIERSIYTFDGATFESEFDSLLVEVEAPERSTHVHRAFLSFANAGLAPGDAVGPFSVASYVGEDLRDAAPGGIPVPGSGGALEYPDPTQIDGQGELVQSIVLEAPTGYVNVTGLATGPGYYDLSISSRLSKGGQHVMVVPRATEGWTFEFAGTPTVSLDAGGGFALAFFAEPAAGVGELPPLRLDVLTDVGGRSPVTLDSNGTLHLPDGSTVAPAAVPPAESPGPGFALLALGLLALGVALSRRA